MGAIGGKAIGSIPGSWLMMMTRVVKARAATCTVMQTAQKTGALPGSRFSSRAVQWCITWTAVATTMSPRHSIASRARRRAGRPYVSGDPTFPSLDAAELLIVHFLWEEHCKARVSFPTPASLP